MRRNLTALLRDGVAQTLSESALIYTLIVVAGLIPLVALGVAVGGFWSDIVELFDSFS